MGANVSLLRAWESWVNLHESHELCECGAGMGRTRRPRRAPARRSPTCSALSCPGCCWALPEARPPGPWPGQRPKLHRGQAVPRAAAIAHEVAKGVKVIGLCPRERGKWRASICPSVVSSPGAGVGHSSHFQELLIIEPVFWDFCEENRL